MTDKSLGIYIHIPFCERKCNYCDFLSFNADDKKKEKYVDVLIREIRESEYAGRRADTVFFGGGTPSVLASGLTEAVMNALRENFRLIPDAEITIECNPGTVDAAGLKAYKEMGFNRISFGLQSVHADELELLGRIHTFADFKKSLYEANEAGFDNINADLMMGLPGQTKDKLMGSLEKLADMGLKHISLYSLILEEGTPMEKNIDKLPELPEEDEERQMYHEAVDFLESKGFTRYEISNFAKEGFECRHNLKYWELDEYLGFGIGAASFVSGRRFSNETWGRFCVLIETEDGSVSQKSEGLLGHDNRPRLNWDAELSSCLIKPIVISEKDLMSEFMFLGLRKTRGIKKSDFKEKFGSDIEDVFGEVIRRQISDGTLKETKEGFALTQRGIDISNYVLADYV